MADMPIHVQLLRLVDMPSMEIRYEAHYIEFIDLRRRNV
jgi:hypothetical protein